VGRRVSWRKPIGANVNVGDGGDVIRQVYTGAWTKNDTGKQGMRPCIRLAVGQEASSEDTYHPESAPSRGSIRILT